MIVPVAIWILLAGCLPAPMPWAELSVDGQIVVEDPDLDLTTDRATVGLVEVQPDGLGVIQGRVWATTVVSGIASGTATFHLDVRGEPPGDSFHQTSDTTPDMQQATFLLGAWVDKDSVDGPSVGDDLVGALTYPFTYLRGDLDPELEVAGAQLGWNIYTHTLSDLAQGETGIAPITSDLGGLELPANLFPHYPDSLSGTIDASLTQDGALGVAFYSYLGRCAEEPNPASPMLDAIPRGATHFTLRGDYDKPPDTHFSVPDLYQDCHLDDTLIGARVAPYVTLAYSSVVVANSLAGHPATLAVYLEPSDLGAAVHTDLGGGMGWQIVRSGVAWKDAFLPWSDSVDLAATGD